MNFPDDLQSGDFLGYHHKDSVIAGAIHLCTGGRLTHAAVYRGHGVVVTSLGSGVNYYDYDPSGLVMVRRPMGMFVQPSADIEFEANMRGLPYGIWDCIRDAFPDVPDSSKGMNCSHTSAQYYLYGGLFLFASDFDLKAVTPRDFELVPDSLLKTIWTAT